LKIVLASSNAGKIKELHDMLSALDMQVVPQQELNIEDIEETGLCFVENAILKARNAALMSGMPAIADDSGLEVDLLNGAPGIYSARFAVKVPTMPATIKSCSNCSVMRHCNSVARAINVLSSICVMPTIRHRLSARAAGRVISP